MRRMNNSPRHFLVQRGVSTRRRKVLDAGNVKKGAPAPSEHHHVPKSSERAHNISLGGNPVTLLCFFGATFDGPWPTKLCSHLVYCGAIMGAGEDWLQLDARPEARRGTPTHACLRGKTHLSLTLSRVTERRRDEKEKRATQYLPNSIIEGTVSQKYIQTAVE
ncbi:uncharacterized protein LOC142814542 [Rhipicephalus microplus]|uniref:uncharacterized protein LOC142814542 n=1 Tax=Rhipicephalus microplus TaxID=6941 RepID=UPI003F6B6EA1